MKVGDLVKEKKFSNIGVNIGLVIEVTTGIILVRWLKEGTLTLWISQERLEVISESR